MTDQQNGRALIGWLWRGHLKRHTGLIIVAFLFMALITVVVQIGVMQFVKMQPRILLRTCFILFGIVVFLMTQITTVMHLYLIFIAKGFAVSLAMPSLTTAASLAVGREDQGVAAGLLAAAPTFGMVLGPTADGGYWAIGLHKPVPGLLRDVAWSTSSTLDDTRRRAAAYDLRVELLDPWTDVDEPRDLQTLAQQIADLRRAGDASTARHSEAFLRQLGPAT